MNDPLAPLLADGVIDEVVGRLKSGKEADVWLVRAGGQVAAAKVYKARHVRGFRNDAAYREGRQVRNTRTQRAMDKGSRFGQAASEDAWKAKESDALHRLHAAGVRVPQPVIFYEGVLVMELVLDGHGHPAPRLIDAHLHREQAAALYADLRHQATAMLACDLVHGDLSPYNVLAGARGPVVIDFPQVVDAAQNSQAERFFLRDVENVRRFCASLDPALRAAESDGREIWRAYVRRELSPDFVPTGRVPEPAGPRQDRGGHRPPRPDGPPRHAQHPQGQGPRPQGQGPRPQGQGPRPQGQGPRPQGQGPRPQGQGPRPQPQGPYPQAPQRSAHPERRPAGGRPESKDERSGLRPRPQGQGKRPPQPPAAPEVVRVQRLVPPSASGGPRHGGGHPGHGHGGHRAGGHGRRGRG